VPDDTVGKRRTRRNRSTVGQPSDTPISRSARALERYIHTPNGGTAPRCQGHKKNGDQCAAPARRGFTVCSRHGAGTRAREKSGERKPVSGGGRMTHGLYSRMGRRRIAEVVAELEAAQIDLDDSDGEMMVLRGALSFLLGQADVHEGALDKITGVYAVLERTLTHQTLDPVEVRVIGNAMTAADRLLGRSESWVRALLDASRFIVKASRERAETKAKVAEARALETLTKYIHVLRGILWDTISEEELDVIEGRLVREIFAPNGLELEGRDEPLVA
jgi:hypothetical protein